MKTTYLSLPYRGRKNYIENPQYKKTESAKIQDCIGGYTGEWTKWALSCSKWTPRKTEKKLTTYKYCRNSVTDDA